MWSWYLLKPCGLGSRYVESLVQLMRTPMPVRISILVSNLCLPSAYRGLAPIAKICALAPQQGPVERESMRESRDDGALCGRNTDCCVSAPSPTTISVTAVPGTGILTEFTAGGKCLHRVVALQCGLVWVIFTFTNMFTKHILTHLSSPSSSIYFV